jgi:hypothetical protein
MMDEIRLILKPGHQGKCTAGSKEDVQAKEKEAKAAVGLDVKKSFDSKGYINWNFSQKPEKTKPPKISSVAKKEMPQWAELSLFS